MMRVRTNSSGYIFLIFLILAISQVNSSYFAENRVSPTDLSATATQGLVVDIYSDRGGQGPNETMGTYTIGETVKFYIYISRNSTIQETVLTSDGSVWFRLGGPVNAGTIIDYFETQYPTGKWAISVKAQAENETVSDIAPFEVLDKQPYVCTKTFLLSTSGSAGEVKFTGRVVKTYVYPVGGVHSWDVHVDSVYFGPDIRNQTVHVQILAATYTAGHPPGYLDENITLGDEVAVYGLLSEQSTSVIVNGSADYYVERLSTLCEQADASTRQERSEETGLQMEAFVMAIVLLIVVVIALRKKYGHDWNPFARGQRDKRHAACCVEVFC